MIDTLINGSDAAIDKRKWHQKIGWENGENHLWGLQGGQTQHPYCTMMDMIMHPSS